MQGINYKAFENALDTVSVGIKNILNKIDPNVAADIQEIRLRSYSPLCVTKMGETFFVNAFGSLESLPNNAYIVSESELKETYRLLSSGSVYSHINEIKDGYIILKHGNRAGVCGTFTEDSALSHITSVNIRIAKQIIGSAGQIAEIYSGGSVLIAGPPGSGKTTVLRDFIRILSSGITGKMYRVCVIDRRGEISAAYLGKIYNDLGPNTDLIQGVPIEKGIEMAIRTMYPNIVAFDEISTQNQASSIIDSFNAGVDVITTAHIFNEDDLLKRKPIRTILSSGAVKWIVVLPSSIGEKMRILSYDRLKLKCIL
ncbi:MAG: hypothetical protein IJN65_03290 [Clostridia bacterium]|nr:hypothetical protein [Clostridia bacterium]